MYIKLKVDVQLWQSSFPPIFSLSFLFMAHPNCHCHIYLPQTVPFSLIKKKKKHSRSDFLPLHFLQSFPKAGHHLGVHVMQHQLQPSETALLGSFLVALFLLLLLSLRERLSIFIVEALGHFFFIAFSNIRSMAFRSIPINESHNVPNSHQQL